MFLELIMNGNTAINELSVFSSTNYVASDTCAEMYNNAHFFVLSQTIPYVYVY